MLQSTALPRLSARFQLFEVNICFDCFALFSSSVQNKAGCARQTDKRETDSYDHHCHCSSSADQRAEALQLTLLRTHSQTQTRTQTNSKSLSQISSPPTSHLLALDKTAAAATTTALARSSSSPRSIGPASLQEGLSVRGWRGETRIELGCLSVRDFRPTS